MFCLCFVGCFVFLQFVCFSFFPSQPDDPNLEVVNILLFQTFRFCVSDLFSFVLSEFLKLLSSISRLVVFSLFRQVCRVVAVSVFVFVSVAT